MRKITRCPIGKRRIKGKCISTKKSSTKRWYVDTGEYLKTKRNYFKSEKDAKRFVIKKSKQGERTGYSNESYHKNTEWKVWWMKGDSTGKLQKRIFNNELTAIKFVALKKKQRLLVGISAQQKGMGLP
jgi:hypothetical protein